MSGGAAVARLARPRPTKRQPARVREAAALLKQAAEPTRLQILLALAEREHRVGELRGSLATGNRSAVDHHLARLRVARLVEYDRRGWNNRYHLTPAGVELARLVAAVVGPS